MRHICEQLGIPHHIVDSREVFPGQYCRLSGRGLQRRYHSSALLPVQQDGEVWPDGTVCPEQLGIDQLRVTMPESL